MLYLYDCLLTMLELLVLILAIGEDEENERRSFRCLPSLSLLLAAESGTALLEPLRKFEHIQLHEHSEHLKIEPFEHGLNNYPTEK